MRESEQTTQRNSTTRARAVSGDDIYHYRALSASSEKRASMGGDDDDALMARLETGAEKNNEEKNAQMLVWSFCAMIGIGLGNKIFQKLQTIPMYNYPNFLNLLTTFMYIPLSFAYVIPASKRGWIREDNFEVPKKDFAVMGFLDSIAGIMQVFAATYLPGSIFVLLLQSAIPASMLLSRSILGTKYHVMQYVSGIVVIGGILVVLAPSLFISSDDDDSNNDATLWSLVAIASCVPMCLSSIYKEISMGETDLDPIYLNAWIAVFQFLFSIPLAIPAALVGTPPLQPSELPQNLWNGLECYVGINSEHKSSGSDDDDDDVHPDNCNPQSPIFVNVYLIFNVCYNILIIFILKYGNANILWLAMTIMVPLGNLAFALPFMPQNTTVTTFDIVGLVVIMAGLVGYRKGPEVFKDTCPMKSDEDRKSKSLYGEIGNKEERMNRSLLQYEESQQ